MEKHLQVADRSSLGIGVERLRFRVQGLLCLGFRWLLSEVCNKVIKGSIDSFLGLEN